MLYYKVKQASDQTNVNNLRFKRITILAGELYTANEINKSTLTIREINTFFDEINISPKNTFWYFGSRKQKTTN